MIRSGYPLLLSCDRVQKNLDTAGHAVCVVGFREPAAPVAKGKPRSTWPDAFIEHIYIHDDNIGPSARFRITTCPHNETPLSTIRDPAKEDPNDPTSYVVLERSPPPRAIRSTSPVRHRDELNRVLVPNGIVAAVHEDLRMNALQLHDNADVLARALAKVWGFPLTVTARFLKAHDYVDSVLGSTLRPDAAATRKARFAMYNQVEPMSLLIGLARIGYEDTPLVDVLFDTTGLDCQARVLCQVAFVPEVVPGLKDVRQAIVDVLDWDYGPLIRVGA